VIEPLAGRVALVTGASRGIGRASAVALAAAGAHLILTARTEGGLIEADDAIAAAGGSATIAPLDLADADGTARLGAAIGQRWGRIDILVLNAAMLGSLAPVWGADPKEFARVFDLNVAAPQRLIAAFDPWLRAAPAGQLIALTSSVAGHPRAYWGPYAASKAALETLALCYAEEVRNISPVRVALVDPGATATTMRARAFPGEDAAALKPPSAVGEAIARLCAEGFETGARVRVG
jgi:NAD(P)-dependent dehydrogenase (short-subunit alcohol dehydrogenase family)